MVGVSSDSNIVILDPLNMQNNTTRNSFLTREILSKFQAAFSSLKNLINSQETITQDDSNAKESAILEQANLITQSHSSEVK